MEILELNTNPPQVDIAVDLGVIPKPLPAIQKFGDFIKSAPPEPPILVEGLLHQGGKMILGGTSKSNKSWCLLDMALSVAAGAPWWGRKTSQANVLFINFELADWAIYKRLLAIAEKRQEIGSNVTERLFILNLRGHAADFSILRPLIEEQLEATNFGLIIIDPAYKVLGDRNENDNGEITSLMNEFERIACKSGAAVVLAHHYAKGDSTLKAASDRMSGAGAWVRDPDTIIVLTPHEEENCFTASTILRNLPQVSEFVLQWEFPLMTVNAQLDPSSLRSPQSKNKKYTDVEFMEEFLTSTPTSFGTIAKAVMDAGMSKSSAHRILTRLAEVGAIGFGQGSYWRL